LLFFGQWRYGLHQPATTTDCRRFQYLYPFAHPQTHFFGARGSGLVMMAGVLSVAVGRAAAGTASAVPDFGNFASFSGGE